MIRSSRWGRWCWSEAEHDHHAFLWWPSSRLAVIPLQSGEAPFAGALGMRVGRAGLSSVGRIAHPAVGIAGSPGGQIRRSLVVRDALLTVSDVGVKASALSTFADLGFARLPQP